MGKKLKKKTTRNAQKEKQFSTSSPKNVSQKIIPTMVVDGVSVVKEARVCPHLDTGVNLDKISLKMSSLKSLKCDDCREGVVDRRASKVKGKHGKKKGSGSAFDSKSIWVCLECGHFTCGGVGFPTTPQSHATRHAKQNRHALAVQLANPNLRWCFPCNTLIPVQTSEENGEQKDTLSDVVKVLKSRPSSENSLDVEDVWFGSGGVTSEIKSVNTPSSSENSGGYMVKGLVNLGNTCFLNSILQNLIAMNKLRDYFLRLEEPVGPLTVSLKKLFVETNPSAGAKNVINPRSLFNSVCAMAPQFKGYQQQDSHELLRFLLDGLCNEESGVQKYAPSSETGSTVPKHTPTFVDAVFGGQTSSTVSCLECGHTSIVYEPYLDLSLPLPTKKSPSKRMPSVSRSKKPKPPPKRRGKFGTRINRASNGVPIIPTSGDSLHAEKKVVHSGDSTQPESVFLSSMGDNNVSAAREHVAQGNVIEKVSEITNKESSISSDNLALLNYVEPATVLNSHGNQTVDSSDISSWLDYLEPTTVSSDHDAAACVSDDIVTEYTGKTELVQEEALLQWTMEARKQVDSLDSVETPLLADDAWLDYLEPSSSSNGHIMASQNDNSSVVRNHGNSNDVFWEDLPQLKVQESEILLLPYKELIPTSNGNEVDMSSVSYEQEPSDFDGFGGLFDEPEVVVGPTVNPFLNGVVESGIMARNNSESDSDEVDNTDSPVSVDKCLTYFTTSELLTKTEHAWHCEQCSKALLEQRMRLKNNGAIHRIPSIPSDSGIEHSYSNGVRNPIDVRGVLGNSDEKSGLHNDKSDCSRVASELEERGSVVNGVSPELSQHPSSVTASSEESCTIQDTDSCEVNKPGDKFKNERVQKRASNRLARQRDFNGVEDENEEVDSSSVKVTRDASKRILVNRVPPILTIHLKRLSQDARGRLSKLNGHIDFNDTIDLKPYMDPSSRGDRGTCRYRLIGVVEHIGTMRGGHYVAYVRGGAKGNDDCLWYHASDAHVREVSLEQVLRCEAYILFYEQM